MQESVTALTQVYQVIIILPSNIQIVQYVYFQGLLMDSNISVTMLTNRPLQILRDRIHNVTIRQRIIIRYGITMRTKQKWDFYGHFPMVILREFMVILKSSASR